MGGAILLCLLLIAPIPWSFAATAGERTAQETPLHAYRVVRSYPHDRHAFTQGLVWDGGALYEGTGLHGFSSLRKVELATGRVLKEIRLDPAYFGEGIALWGERIIQVTWQSRVGFVYDKTSFRPLGQFSYPHEGWGLTQDGKRLIMSDGTATLHLLDPVTLRETGSIGVHDERGPVTGLNELEYIRGAIYANLWPTDQIAVINPLTGRIKARIDLQGLLHGQDAQGVDVLNGIAYNARDDRLFVTGKFWPKLFELKRTVP